MVNIITISFNKQLKATIIIKQNRDNIIAIIIIKMTTTINIMVKVVKHRFKQQEQLKEDCIKVNFKQVLVIIIMDILIIIINIMVKELLNFTQYFIGVYNFIIHYFMVLHLNIQQENQFVIIIKEYIKFIIITEEVTINIQFMK